MVLPNQPAAPTARPTPAFSEASAWQTVGEGWQPLQGSFRNLGFSVEWHDFSTKLDLDWASSFHPGSVEICLNLDGRGEVQGGNRRLEFAPETAGFYFQEGSRLRARRTGGERHRFLTVELSVGFLSQHLAPKEPGLAPPLRRFLAGESITEVSAPVRLTFEHQQLVTSLRQPPVAAAAQRLWYHAKALEIASALLYPPEATGELFCQRLKRQNRERVARVIAVLTENLTDPPSLEEIGRRVGCSQFYLSRIFTQETGRSIFQHLRAVRMERAAQLLQEGRMNVTQVALAVGYSSPSHFSTAFHETFGCCPGLYPHHPLGAGVRRVI
jgi:AraC family transcriptional regulator